MLVTTSACTLTGGLVLCGWLHSVTRGAWLVVHPISVRVCTAVGRGWAGCIWIVYTPHGSVEVWRLTVSLVLRILVCFLAVVVFRSLQLGLTVLQLSPILSCRPVHIARIPQRSSSRLCTLHVDRFWRHVLI